MMHGQESPSDHSFKWRYLLAYLAGIVLVIYAEKKITEKILTNKILKQCYIHPTHLEAVLFFAKNSPEFDLNFH